MESIVWENEDLGATFTIGPIPDDLKEKAAEYHALLVEQVRARCAHAPFFKPFRLFLFLSVCAGRVHSASAIALPSALCALRALRV